MAKAFDIGTANRAVVDKLSRIRNFTKKGFLYLADGDGDSASNIMKFGEVSLVKAESDTDLSTDEEIFSLTFSMRVSRQALRQLSLFDTTWPQVIAISKVPKRHMNTTVYSDRGATADGDRKIRKRHLDNAEE